MSTTPHGIDPENVCMIDVLLVAIDDDTEDPFDAVSQGPGDGCSPVFDMLLINITFKRNG